MDAGRPHQLAPIMVPETVIKAATVAPYHAWRPPHATPLGSYKGVFLWLHYRSFSSLSLFTHTLIYSIYPDCLGQFHSLKTLATLHQHLHPQLNNSNSYPSSIHQTK